MIYLKVVNGDIIYPYNINNLKIDFPSTSFPEDIKNCFLDDYGVFKVEDVEKPSDDNFTKIITEGTPVKNQGKYIKSWIVEQAPSSYTEEMLKNRNDNKWSEIRVVRNKYLTECDWTQLEDAPFNSTKKSEWRKYRQDLRDITNQTDPFNIIWPVKPQ